MRRTVVLLVGLAGCEADNPSGAVGQVRVCLETDASASPVVEGAYDRWEVEGTVTALQATGERPGGGPYLCAPGIGRVVELADGDGKRWRFGWYASSANVDLTPELGLQVGDVIDVTLAHLNDFADDRALVVRDAAGLVLAAEEGYGARASELAGDLLDGLTVERGANDLSLFYDTECGRLVPQELVFAADGAEVVLSPWQAGQITVGGVALEARNVGARTFLEQPTCTDTWGPAPWMVWR